ncbi:TPA: hypothetical protein LQO36_002300, partial [Staphylococcus pseudintermedius]|nr:hypothetical protein [Staphylococcus pseudintermedius]
MSEIRRGSISAKFAAELRKEVANDFGGGQTDSLDYYFGSLSTSVGETIT